MVFKIHVKVDCTLMACSCAMMETLWDYCPRESKPWWQNTAQIGSKMLYLPKPGQFVWIVPITSIFKLGLTWVACPWFQLARQEQSLTVCMQGSRHASSMESVTRLMSLVLAACSSISIRGQCSFNQIIQPECCISKPYLWSCN